MGMMSLFCYWGYAPTCILTVNQRLLSAISGHSSRSAKLIVQKRFNQRDALLVSKLLPTVRGPMNHLKLNLQIVFLVGVMEFV